ncbi:glutamate--cysteine ligase regulatory subunit-like [Rhagoletis pomonella]|uniref:glutamate--cysteine ligase regulatory subunit-like n=1 Tax=Rhagoletis pomonella TaxID=28610 RepID=UPI001786590E|nr:glutamate--cysteine ligase regulatory subunit-like [Rhagoletis pomonella]XP_036324605.1 glutamate--cysteine ligase regulatory subunit-like [Rhagoletis pomonella]
MIPAITSNDKFHNVIISTGNILNMNNQLGGKSTEEVLHGLRLTLQCQKAAAEVELIEADGRVLRATEELKQKLTENDRSEISIGAKLFLNKNSSVYIEQAISTLLQVLKVEHVDNLVLAYHAKNESVQKNSNEKVYQLRQLWASLEKFAQQKQITQLGVADLDIEELGQLNASAIVHPTIAQINLESCCVVPPALKDYCTKHDIQLLTHSDPEVLLPDDQFIVPDYQVDWALRYQVHVRCRGVITAKGYILGASKHDQTNKSAVV